MNDRRINTAKSFGFYGYYPPGTAVEIAAKYLAYCGMAAKVVSYSTEKAYPYMLQRDAVNHGPFKHEELRVCEDKLHWASHPIKGGYRLMAFQECASYLENGEQKPPAIIVLLLDDVLLAGSEKLGASVLTMPFVPRWEGKVLVSVTLPHGARPVRNKGPETAYGKIVWD